MRIVFEKSFPDYRLTVFHWNNKYLFKVEQSMFEQTYKLSEMDVLDEQELRSLLEDAQFQEHIAHVFQTMRQGFSESIQRLNII